MTQVELIINQFILESGKLYSFPELYQQLDEKIQSHTTSLDEIADLLSTDATLNAKLLKLANSSLYGFRAKISTMSKALKLIGLKEVKNLILMEAVAQNFTKNDKNNTINMEDFWRRSVYIALIAKRLAKRINHPEAERLFVSGIMSRIGQLVSCVTHAKEVLAISHEVDTRADDEFTIETNILGCSYNEISAKLLEHWQVPQEITIPLFHLHQPLNLPQDINDSLRNDIYILHSATVYTYLIEQEERQNLRENNQAATLTAETCLNKINNEINQTLMIDAKAIDDILFEIEIDAVEIMSIVLPKSMSIY